MADPLSLAASIAGLISLADLVFKHTYKFVRAAKDAKDEIKSLVDEINNLASVLRRLEALTSDLEDEGEAFDPTLRNHYLNHCYKTFTRIETRIKKAGDSFKKSKLDGIVRQLKWPFSLSETKELLAELSRHKETISVALAADSMRKIQLSLTKSEDLDKKIADVRETARRIEINTLIAVREQEQRVLNHFMKSNPQISLETSIRLRHSMTGLWLTESPTFIRWLETPESKLWLTGIPGAGKTVLAGSVIQEALSRSYSSRGIGVAFFFCDYKDPDTWKSINILGALASQLARQSDEAFRILDQYYTSLYPPDGLPQTADPEELRAQINKMSEKFDQTIIVVDGLDECGDLTDEVVENLIQLADYSERLSLALFSRDHYNIRIRLEDEFETIPIAAHTEDVRLYVNAEVDKRIRTRQLQLTSMGMKEEILRVLVGKADGMFRWVVCQLDYLCNCAHDEERREALNKLPPDLPESYRRLLERVNNCSPGVQAMVQMCLQFMAVTEPRLTILELRQAISTSTVEYLNESNMIPEHEIMKRCSSLIRKSTNGIYFEFAHFSVREFLENEKALSQSTGLEKYWITRETRTSLLATQCLRFLQMKNFDTIPDVLDEQVAATRQRNETYPFYRHAALLWITLTRDGLENSTISGLVRSLFQPSKRTYFVCWAIEVFKHVMYATGTQSESNQNHECERQAWKITTLPSFQPLHMAAALNLPEICSFLIEAGSDVNRKLDAATTLDLAMMTALAVPGLPDMSDNKALPRGLVAAARKKFLPSPKRRNITIHCLVAAGAQPSGQAIPPNTLSVFSFASLFASIFNDLYPVFQLLCCHIKPSMSEIRILRNWLIPTNARLENQVSYFGPVHGLLHLAIKHHAFNAFQILVTAGYDPYMQGENGDLPIHLCERQHGSQTFKMFKDLGISLVSQNKKGYNIFHCWVEDRPFDHQFINDMFTLDSQETIEGLQTRTPQGDTPLAILFKHVGESPMKEHCDLDLTGLCSEILRLIEGTCRGPKTEASVDTETGGPGSMEAMRVFEAMVRTEPTPLHCLNPWVSKQQVQLLVEVYPSAIDNRHEGELPIESYIRNTLEKHEFPSIYIAEILFPANLIESVPGTQQTLWSFICGLSSNRRWFCMRGDETYGLDALVRLMLRLGAMRAHEEQLSECGLRPLLANYIDSSMSTFRTAIQQTKYWDSMRRSQLISRLFQDVIRKEDLNTIRLLIKYEADPYHRVDGYSPIETALSAPKALNICSSEEGTSVLKDLLEHSASEELINSFTEDGNLTLLHTLATPEDATNILWLAEALDQKGLDLNQIGPGSEAEPALVYHIGKHSFQFAEILLDLGADPFAKSVDCFDAISKSVIINNVTIFQSILGHIKKTTNPFPLVRSVSFSTNILDEDVLIKDGSILHLASNSSSVQCLEFILEQGLVPKENWATEKGLTPVHIAAYKGSVDVIRLLLAKGFDPMAKDELGYTPLHMAVDGRSMSACKFLLEHGAFQSPNASGETPARIAFDQEFEEIFWLLEGKDLDDYEQGLLTELANISGKHISRLAMSFERAIEEEDYGKMEQMIRRGCPIDIPLPEKGGISALLLALDQEWGTMAEWLLGMGASALTAGYVDGDWILAIEIAACRPSLNDLLPDLLRSYIWSGGDLVYGCELPFHAALERCNTQGVELLLQVSEESMNGIGFPQPLRAIVNRLEDWSLNCEDTWNSGTHDTNIAPLHMAAWKSLNSTASLLVETGADINAPDENGWTPLIYARNADMAQHLVSLGASISAICRLGSLPALINWFGSDLFCDLYPSILSRLPKELFSLSTPSRFPMKCEGAWLTPELLEKLSELKYDLLAEDETGLSMMHCIMCEDDLLGMVLRGDKGLGGTSPFPWHLEWRPFSSLDFLTSSFSQLRKKVPSDELRKIMNLEPSRGWSPLCRAAALNFVEIVENCLIMGADIDFEGSCFGSAVMNASACGSLDAVRALARNGAKLTYTCQGKFRSCYSLAGTEEVREWLLSGRFRDQRRITEQPNHACPQEVIPWCGYVQVEVKLYGMTARWPEESTLDYAKRLSGIRRSWQGKVVPGVEEASVSILDVESGTESDEESGSGTGSDSEPQTVVNWESGKNGV
ncbi:hypothetical protein F53441_3721 [Fusarium austroafricanum]|uniref:PI-PLC Y-box domain-containing protein n=1 Tax=Fusarium austroafricanum TaxID=2364996 RepID=A0A8H4KM59_9HYPO|nr:hypothetical protein F53441_3721 [Fusarium austroafricanum]